jgi:putative membrane protein
MDMEKQNRLPLTFLLLTLLALGVSAIAPEDCLTWWLEVAPVLIALPLLLLTRQRFPLTPLLYTLIFLHALVLILGAHYTYAKVPLGFWIQEAFGFERNHYDRLGHFMQGFGPAILAREILIRKEVVRRGGWLTLFVLSVCLAFSACYEFIEWLAALVNGQAAESFLGTQGDVWDTQWDMFLCLIGAASALVLLSRCHDAQLRRLRGASLQ